MKLFCKEKKYAYVTMQTSPWSGKKLLAIFKKCQNKGLTDVTVDEILRKYRFNL